MAVEIFWKMVCNIKCHYTDKIKFFLLGIGWKQAWSRINGVSIALLGLSGIFNDVALYWVVLILFIQRGPIPPQADEITAPDNTYVTAGVAVLLLGLLICAPLPFSF